jgi:Ca2+-binding RTX toxin-like protein
MRRIFVVLALAALLVAIAAPAAVALNERCDTNPCNGTNNKDRLSERRGNGTTDNIRGLERDDRLRADRYSRDRDTLKGGEGDDVLHSDDGDSKDLINGGKGSDTCVGDDGDRLRNCEFVFTS